MPRHDLDVFSLFAGLLAAGSAVVWLVDRNTLVAPRWAAPVLLIVVGVVGLVASRRNASGTDAGGDEVP